jgi:hypothetical protein
MNQGREYKYATEATVNVTLKPYRICQEDEFGTLQQLGFDEDLKYYNIYLVCQRNRIGIKQEYIKTDENSIDLRFEVWEKDEKFVVSFGLENQFETTDLTIKSEYPYTYFELKNNSGETVYADKPSYILDNSHDDNSRFKIIPRPSFLDLEILYIGRATRNSSKPVIDRLVGHNKLQEAYLHANRSSPDKEIFIVLCAFVAGAHIFKSGTIKTKKEFEEKDKDRLNNFISGKLKLTAKEEASLAEAALIKYFQPKYNKHHKSTFPTPKNLSYNIIYKLDIKSILLCLKTELHFFTETVNSNNKHLITFPLNTDADRKDFFDL